MTPEQKALAEQRGQQWKCGNEFLPYHSGASHAAPEYRDGWNHCYAAATAEISHLRDELERMRILVINGGTEAARREAEIARLREQIAALQGKALVHEWRRNTGGMLCFHCGLTWLENAPEPTDHCGYAVRIAQVVDPDYKAPDSTLTTSESSRSTGVHKAGDAGCLINTSDLGGPDIHANGYTHAIRIRCTCGNPSWPGEHRNSGSCHVVEQSQTPEAIAASNNRALFDKFDEISGTLSKDSWAPSEDKKP